MASSQTDRADRQVRALLDLGRLGDRTDGELLDWIGRPHADAGPAFEELIRRHGAMVRDVCRRILRTPHDAEDAFQATFLVLVRRAGSIRDGDNLGGWLHRVALRVAVRARGAAARRRVVEHLAVPATTSSSAPDDAEQADLRRALHEELDRLPVAYRAALIACHLEGLTHEEAAHRLSWPVGTVRSRLARGRDRLRARLARRGLAPGVILPEWAGRPEWVPFAGHERAVRGMVVQVAGRGLAGTVPATVAALAEGMIRAMKTQSFTSITALVLTLGAVAGMIPLWRTTTPRPANAAHQGSPPRPAAAPQPEPPSPIVLSGVVRDFEGHPVAGAIVVAGTFSQEPNHLTATTDRAGRFEVRAGADAKKPNYVMAFMEGLAPASKFVGVTGPAPPPGGLELVLKRAEPFVGTIRNEAGRPVTGASVRISGMLGPGGRDDFHPIADNVLAGTPLERLVHATTDPQGGFRFPAVPAPQRVIIRASAEGMGDLDTTVPDSFEGGRITGTPAAPARLTMVPEARIKGRVVTRLAGVGVAGLKVGLQNTNKSQGAWRDAVTDADGRFTMRGLHEGGVNLFPMDRQPDGNGPWTWRAIDDLRLEPGQVAEVELELIAGVRVEGRTVDAGGHPVADVAVAMYGPARPHSGAAVQTAKSDASGVYRFRLPPGTTRLYGFTEEKTWKRFGREVTIPADAATFVVPDFVLEPAAGPAATRKEAVRPR